ncbi:hypothetical protein PanWU01x14_162820, partial [Parasponia andersonii]
MVSGTTLLANFFMWRSFMQKRKKNEGKSWWVGGMSLGTVWRNLLSSSTDSGTVNESFNCMPPYVPRFMLFSIEKRPSLSSPFRILTGNDGVFFKASSNPLNGSSKSCILSPGFIMRLHGFKHFNGGLS